MKLILLLTGFFTFAACCVCHTCFSLRKAPCNIRSGPGKEYPVTWILQKSSLPLVVVAEVRHWFRVKDEDGLLGWIKKSMLSKKHTAWIKEQTFLYSDQHFQGKKAILKPGVLVFVSYCEKEYCKVSLESPSLKGYASAQSMWPNFKENV